MNSKKINNFETSEGHVHIMTDEERKEYLQNMSKVDKERMRIQGEKQRYRKQKAKEIGYLPEKEWMKNI